LIQVAGVDACPRGWVAVELMDQRFIRALTRRSFAEVMAALPADAIVGVDIPIGLPDGGRRAPDQLARDFVGARRSSVFFTPSRQLLEGPWAAGLGISIQAHGLGKRIFEVEAALDDRIYEVHPEVCFRAMKGDELRFSKLSWNGLAERRSLLAQHGIVLNERFDDQVGALPPDDLVDAAAGAWTAHRIATNAAGSLPATLPRTGHRPIAIWY
jgi:predicted RNase H-like nuclease